MDDVFFYLRILLQKLHYVFAIAFAVLLAAILVTRFISPVYSASAKLLAEAPQIPSDLARSTVSLSGAAQAQVLQQQITSREALLAMSKRLEIYPSGPDAPSDNDVVADLRSRIDFEHLQLDPSAGQSVALVVVSFRASDPVLAAEVANELALLIVGGNRKERADRAGNTLSFFNRKAASLEAALKNIEAEILAFTNANGDTLPESLDFRRNQQVSLQERSLSLEREEAELRTRRSNIISNFADTGDGAVRPSLSPPQQTLADLNKALSEQLTIYADDSPMVAATRSRIAAVQKTIMGEGEAPTTADETDEADKEKKKSTFGPQLLLSDIDNRLEAIANDKLETAARLEALGRSIDATPATESKLTALLRDRANIQLQYNAAIAQQAEASTGEQIEVRSDGQRFTLLENAVPPSKTDGPERRLIIAGGGLAGIGIGLALVLSLELLNRTVRRPKELEGLLGADALGTIPLIEGRKNARSPRLKYWLTRAGLPVSIVIIHCAFVSLDPVGFFPTWS